MRKAVKSLVIIGFTLFLLSNRISVDATGRTEYVYLKVSGDSMNPALRDGNTVKVTLRVNGSSIDVGDIIVYCTLATGNPHPKAMFIGHRVISKYMKDGIWYFRTKGDNSPEPDPWEVPQHFLLGVIVSVIPTSKQTEPSITSQQNLDGLGDSAILCDLFLGLAVGLLIGFAMSKHMRRTSTGDKKSTSMCTRTLFLRS